MAHARRSSIGRALGALGRLLVLFFCWPAAAGPPTPGPYFVATHSRPALPTGSCPRSWKSFGSSKARRGIRSDGGDR